MRLSILVFALCASVCVFLGLKWDGRLASRPENGILLRSQAAYGFSGSGERRPFRNVARRGGEQDTSYGFLNFNSDFITLNYAVALAALRDYMANFGYTDQDLDDLKNWRKKVHELAYKNAVEKGYSQETYDGMLRNIDAEYSEKKQEFFTSRGFRLTPDNVIGADIPGIVGKNRERMNVVARELESVAQQRNYGSEDLVGAALALVQTGVMYRIPPSKDENGRYTGGVIPPVASLSEAWGDCDSKSALLGSILNNWNAIKLLVIAVPGHYLMAICRPPGRGDLFVEYHGVKCVLMEPAGPAWLAPGTVGADTREMITAGQDFELEPFFKP
ncbi:MAG: hypothetical protein GX410_06130 [Elusimicrobia bacterium]|nr:hypothetical protein [Elusimicrobiota bacterium]